MVTLMGSDTVNRNKFLGKSGLYDLNPSLNTAPRNDTLMTLSELFHSTLLSRGGTRLIRKKQ